MTSKPKAAKERNIGDDPDYLELLERIKALIMAYKIEGKRKVKKR